MPGRRIEATINHQENQPMTTTYAITAGGLKPIGKEPLYLGAGQLYYFGASSAPEMVIISRVSGGMIHFYGYPYRTERRAEMDMFKHLAETGTLTWLKSRAAKYRPELAKQLAIQISGLPGTPVDYRDFQRVLVVLKAPNTGTPEDPVPHDPWSDWERKTDNRWDVSYADNDGRTLYIACSRGDAARLSEAAAEYNYAVLETKED
jgi:hypothetical protein